MQQRTLINTMLITAALTIAGSIPLSAQTTTPDDGDRLQETSTKTLESKDSAAADAPNILFIFSDDQMWDSIGAFENCPVKTPNLDRLARRSVRFSHAYNSGSFNPAVCIASRTMLNTGATLWNAAAFSRLGNNVHEKNSHKTKSKHKVARRQPEAYWSQYMAGAGYETYFTGKWHVGEVKPARIFDHATSVRAGMPGTTNAVYKRSFQSGKPDKWSPANKKLNGFWKGGKHWSEVLASDSEAFLAQAKQSEKPFFMYLAFNAPHDPRQSPQEFVDMYPVDEVEVPKNFLPEYPYNEAAGSGRGLRDEKLAPFPRTEHSIKVNRQEYFALITHMDVQIGRILDALEATGKADNTYIFFTSDHGLAVGDHGFLGKQNMYDSSMRVPLLMAGPGIPEGKTVDAPVYLQDVMATSLEIAEIEKPKQVEFNSLLPLATGKTDRSSYDAIYGAYYGTQRMIRTSQYKMIIYPTVNVVRFYDMIEDPLEMNDLAVGSTRPVEVMNSLFSDLQKLQLEMNDPLDLSDTYKSFMDK